MMTIVAQIRQIDMRKVFSYPLGPVPWALATSSGSMRKTNKALLAQALEKMSTPVESLAGNIATIVDAMSIVHKVKGNQKTFGELSKEIFSKILTELTERSRIDVVFDVYCNISIKNIERVENTESSVAPTIKHILPNHKIHQ